MLDERLLYASVRDSVLQECLGFLDHCEIYGRNVKTIIEQPLENETVHQAFKLLLILMKLIRNSSVLISISKALKTILKLYEDHNKVSSCIS